jgi:hypothetical protein
MIKMFGSKKLKYFIEAILIVTLIVVSYTGTSWCNGGYSDSPDDPKYGTHDWIAHHALDFLPYEEKEYLEDNLNLYLYGTELPDNGNAPDGIGDTWNHHVYFYKDGEIQDDIGAIRAQEEYIELVSYLEDENYEMAALKAGIMSHYIADVGVFGHVMGAETDWGEEKHHSDYESYVERRIDGYESEFNYYIGSYGLEKKDAYESTIINAYITTFGDDYYTMPCWWMDENYDWGDIIFKDSCGESLNRCVNLVAWALHAAYDEATDTGIKIVEPKVGIYVNNKKIGNAIFNRVVIGNPTIKIESKGVYKIKIENEKGKLIGSDTDTDFDREFTICWRADIQDFGYHRLRIKAYNKHDKLLLEEKMDLFVVPLPKSNNKTLKSHINTKVSDQKICLVKAISR